MQEKPIYKTIKKHGKDYIIFDTAQAVANIYNYNKELGTKY